MKKRSLKIFKRSILTILGVTACYALYSLKKTKKVENIKDASTYDDVEKNLKDSFEGREYIKLADIPKKGDK